MTFVAPAAVACAVVALVACSADERDFQEQGERFIEGDEVREKLGNVRMSDAECQEPENAVKDTTYECSATGSDDNAWVFRIEITGATSLRVISAEVIAPATPTTTG